MMSFLQEAAQAAQEEAGDLGGKFADLWTKTLVVVDGQPITIRKIVIGMALLALGFLASRGLSRTIRRTLFPRLRLTEAGSAAIESLLFYVLLVIFALSGLSVAGVPLTAFTLLGGAAAIGIGFGSQTVISNFISGLIILAERPIKVGDLVQVGDLYGTVEHVGPRSTRVRTGDNMEIIVPNSSFLEQNVVNLTLSESRMRAHVAVGVAYGSPTDEVARLLVRAAQEHERVANSPAPFTLFTDFGDNALGFEVHFWIEMRKMMDRRTIESDVRFKIDQLFREAGIVIAFPQRDVHLDTDGPFEVRVLGPATPAAD